MDTQVKFVDEPGGLLAGLEIRAPGPSTLMVDLVRELFRMRVEVLLAESRAAQGGRHERLHLRDASGCALTSDRRAEVQAAVLEAMERLLQRRAPRVADGVCPAP